MSEIRKDLADVLNEVTESVEVTEVTEVADVTLQTEIDNLDVVTEVVIDKTASKRGGFFKSKKPSKSVGNVSSVQALIDSQLDEDSRVALSSTMTVDFTEGFMRALSGDESKSTHKIITNNVIGFTGVKGGVGVSTIVANIGALLNKKGYSVCIVDTSILAPTQPYLWGLGVVKAANSLLTLAGSDDVASVVNKVGMSTLGVVYCSNNTLVDAVSVDKGSVITTALRWLSMNFDIVLVDISNELTCISTAAKVECHVLYPVWTPSLHSVVTVNKDVRNARLSAIKLEKMNHIIVNQRIGLSADYKALARKYHFTILADMPWCLEYSDSSNTGKLFVNTTDTSRTTLEVFKQLQLIVDHIVGN